MSHISLLEFSERINEIMPVLMKEFSRHLLKGVHKVTLPQLFVLQFLHDGGETKMTDLAHFMNVSTAAMTGIVERLVRDGYVVRAPDSQDRRIIKIRLTSRGASLIKVINEQKRQMIVKVFGKVSERDRSDYLRILIKIKDVLIKDKKFPV